MDPNTTRSEHQAASGSGSDVKDLSSVDVPRSQVEIMSAEKKKKPETIEAHQERRQTGQCL